MAGGILMAEVTFSDEVIEELIRIVKDGKAKWSRTGYNYYSEIGGTGIYFYEGYVDSGSQSKDFRLHIGNIGMKKRLYSYEAEKSCTLTRLGKAIRDAIKIDNTRDEQELNEELLGWLRGQ
jgi:hypothetical protein